MVINDGSDDGTGDVVRRYEGDRIHLFERRRLKLVRGKGMALNMAYAWAQTRFKEWFPDLRDDQIIVGVTDADVFLHQNVIVEVASTFNSASDVGAVQAPVSIKGADEIYGCSCKISNFRPSFSLSKKRATDLFGCYGREWTVYFRYSAMKTLGNRPWTRALTEDIDLGLALTGQGHRICFTGKTPVVQHGLTNFHRLLKQRYGGFKATIKCGNGSARSLWRSKSRLITKVDSTPLLDDDCLFL